MARARTRSQFQFESASRQLDTRDLDNITDPTTDLGGAVEQAVLAYETGGGIDLQPEYPGLDIMDGSIAGPLSQLGNDFGLLAAVMDRATGYETYPAALPSLGTWSSPSASKIRWTPNAPGIYQWYAYTLVALSTVPDPDTGISFRQPLPDVMDDTWGGDVVPAQPSPGGDFMASAQGLLMTSSEMLTAGFGGLNMYGPYYELAGGELVDSNYVVLVVSSWNPGGTVPYLGGI